MDTFHVLQRVLGTLDVFTIYFVARIEARGRFYTTVSVFACLSPSTNRMSHGLGSHYFALTQGHAPQDSRQDSWHASPTPQRDHAVNLEPKAAVV